MSAKVIEIEFTASEADVLQRICNVSQESETQIIANMFSTALIAEAEVNGLDEDVKFNEPYLSDNN